MTQLIWTYHEGSFVLFFLKKELDKELIVFFS